MSRNQFIEGIRLLNGEVIVTVAGRLLDPFLSQAVCNHSRSGFAWGYGSSGPAQLALAILMVRGVPPHVAVRFYQSFKWDCISRLPATHFNLPIVVVDRWIQGNIRVPEELQTT